MVMFEEKDGLEVEEVNIVGKNSDWMMVRVKEGGEEWKVAVVYLGTGGGGETLEKNKIILREIGIEVRKAEREEETIFVVGDFNGHLGYIGYQEENENGKLINEFMSENDLILMNCDEKCEGLYTWERQEMKSVIDLIFTNMRGYGKIKKIKIDEQRERVDLSDHCLIEVQLKGKHMDKANWRLGEIREGYSRKKEKLLIFSNKIEEKIREEGIGIALERINRIMKETAEEELKIKYKSRIDEKEREEPPWFKKEIKKEIAERRNLNKIHRRSVEVDSKEEAWKKYKEQKDKVKVLIRIEMEKYESGIAVN